MKQYLELLKDIRDNGCKKSDRTGVGTISVFGRQMRHDLSSGFPLLTTKEIHFRSVVYELLWFLRGDTNVKYLNDHGVSIWNEWADENGDLGPIYGKQWRSIEHPKYKYSYIDQIYDTIKSIKKNPDSRRHIVCSWNPVDIPQMALPPCHCLFQFYVAEGKLSCQLYQRSCDFFLGVPFNIASYALLTHMFAQVCDLEVGEFVHTFGDAHIYLNHLDQVEEQLSREPRELPRLELNPEIKEISKFDYEDIHLISYSPLPKIKAQIAV